MTIVCASASAAPNEEPLKAASALARSSHHRLVLASVERGKRDQRAARGVEFLLRADHTNAIAQILHGALDVTIANLCEQVRARLLVVGSPHVVHTWQPSKVERLAFSVRVPMLVVRDAAPFVAWTAGDAPLCVLVVVNSTSWPDPADRGRAWIAELGPRALENVTDEVWHSGGELARDGFQPIACGDSADEIVEVAAREGVDLIVLTHREQGVAGVVESIAHELLLKSSASVALVPEPHVGPVG